MSPPLTLALLQIGLLLRLHFDEIFSMHLPPNKRSCLRNHKSQQAFAKQSQKRLAPYRPPLQFRGTISVLCAHIIFQAYPSVTFLNELTGPV
jgi:hypothetical protein